MEKERGERKKNGEKERERDKIYTKQGRLGPSEGEKDSDRVSGKEREGEWVRERVRERERERQSKWERESDWEREREREREREKKRAKGTR